MRRALLFLVLLTFLFGTARDASADLTAFYSENLTPSSRAGSGVALSLSLLLLGFEFEYSDTGKTASANSPSLRTGMFNLEVQTPTVARLKFYGTVGGGVYRERLIEHQETGFGANIGAGVKVTVTGPIGIRLDYRAFQLNGDPLHKNPQRIYAGLNLAF